MNSPFLPTSKKEMEALGWEQPDVILFMGDAYVDHPSFGVSVLARVLEAKGYKVISSPHGYNTPHQQALFSKCISLHASSII